MIYTEKEHKSSPSNERWIKLPEVSHLTTYSRSTIYRLVSEGVFPKGVKLSPRAIVWKLSDVHSWMIDKEQQAANTEEV
ncbi:helix-turn-helix transcriptional regulator [Endozoicomonas sp.]|uniref:helix-turn-helix transcriptional regulator n=1 Tax=Endozoicomonas sp. TaxID=1892382 RepID=UPI00383BC228